VEKYVRQLIEKSSQILLVHHWDADGIASAAIIAESHENAKNYCPPIGLFKVNKTVLDEIERRISGKEDLILILDWNIPFEDAEKIERKFRVKVALIDHHHKDTTPPKPAYYNPVAYGESEANYPSTTWTIIKALGRQLDLKVLLGVFGDLEEQATKLKIYHEEIKPYMDEKKYTIEDLISAAKRLNACGRTGDRKLVEKSVWKLINHNDDLKSILKDEEWRRTQATIEEELSKIIIDRREAFFGNIIVKKFSSPYNITSEVARKLAKLNPKSIIVVLNQSEKLAEAEIYVRRGSMLNVKLTQIINKLRKAGLEAGGKEAVFGVKVAHSKVEEALKLILSMLMEELNIG